MLVVKIIAGLISLLTLYLIMKKINNYTHTHYQYVVFDWFNYILVAASYACFYFGHKLYSTALLEQGDWLNGILLIGIGIIGIIFMCIINFSKLPMLIGLLVTVVQLSIYVILSIVGFYALIALFILSHGIRPVYNLNSK